MGVVEVFEVLFCVYYCAHGGDIETEAGANVSWGKYVGWRTTYSIPPTVAMIATK